MKTICATLVLLGLSICSAAANDTYRSTVSGNVTIEVTAKDTDEAPPAAKPDKSLTIRFVPPPEREEPDEHDAAQKLRACGEKWNKKLKAYEIGAQAREKYLAYYDRWQHYPPQRAPRPGEPALSRITYRTCMYACLQDRPDECPGGWATERDRTTPSPN